MQRKREVMLSTGSKTVKREKALFGRSSCSLSVSGEHHTRVYDNLMFGPCLKL